MKIDVDLKNGMERAFKSFKENELSLLALTSKPEGVIRDRLAWGIQSASPERWPALCVAREWKKRIDLAVLGEGPNWKPRALIQLTAMTSYNALDDRKAEQYQEKMRLDAAKAKSAGDPRSEIYLILISTDIKGNFEKLPRNLVKFEKSIRRAIGKHGDSVRDRALQIINKWLCGAPHGGGCSGEIYGMQVCVDYWIYRVQ